MITSLVKHLKNKSGEGSKDYGNKEEEKQLRPMGWLDRCSVEIQLAPVQLYLELDLRVEGIKVGSDMKHIHRLVAYSLIHTIALEHTGYYRSIPYIGHFILNSIRPHYLDYKKLKKMYSDTASFNTIRGMTLQSLIPIDSPRMIRNKRKILELQLGSKGLILIDVSYKFEIGTYSRSMRFELRNNNFKDILESNEKYNSIIKAVNQKARDLGPLEIDNVMQLYISSAPKLGGIVYSSHNSIQSPSAPSFELLGLE